MPGVHQHGRGIGQLSVRLRDAEVLVLIRERTQFPRSLLEKLPKLKLISQTGGRPPTSTSRPARAWHRGGRRRRRLNAGGADLGLIMASMRRLPQYIGNLKHGAWQQAGLKSASMPVNFGIGMLLRGRRLASGATADRPEGGRLWPRLWHAGAGLGAARLRASAGRGRWLSRLRQREVSSKLRCAEPAPAPGRRHARHRHAGRLGPHEADRPFVNTSRAELVVDGALVQALNRGRPAWPAVDVRQRTHPAGPPAAAPGKRRLHAAHRLRRARQLRDDFDAAFEERPQLHPQPPIQHRRPEALKVIGEPAGIAVSALFVAFSRLALQGFGGCLAVAQRELVERLGWLTRKGTSSSSCWPRPQPCRAQCRTCR